MKLGHWIAALGCLGIGGMGVTAIAVIQACTTAGTACTGDCGQGSNGQIPDDDAGATAGDDSGGGPANDDAGTSSGETPIDTGSTPPNSCNTCLYGQCIGSYSNCVANASCLGIYQCATSPACAADGGSCVQSCYNAGTTTAQALYIALRNCNQAAQCTSLVSSGGSLSPNAPCAACSPSPAQCAIEDAGAEGDDAGAEADDAGPGDAEDAAASGGSAPSCSACQSSACGSQLAACAVGTECAAYNQCLGGCSDATCDTACAGAFPAGASSAQALGACTTSGCSQCFD